MYLVNKLIGGFVAQPEPKQEVPAGGPKDFYCSKVQSFNEDGFTAWIIIHLEKDGESRELIIPMPIADFRNIYLANECPALENLNVVKYGKSKHMSPELKEAIFDSIAHNKDSLSIEGRNWTILPNKGVPKRY
jgi:hypothetical protein